MSIILGSKGLLLIPAKKGFHAIYTHGDSSPGHHLPILNSYYKTTEQIAWLLKYGKGGIRELDKPSKIIFYSPLPPKMVYSHNDILKLINKAAMDYVYLYSNKLWFKIYSKEE